MTNAEVITSLNAAKGHYPDRDGLHLFASLARVWHHEGDVIGRSPKTQLADMARALGLDDEGRRFIMSRIAKESKDGRMAELPRITEGSLKRGRPTRWVIETAEGPKIVTR